MASYVGKLIGNFFKYGTPRILLIRSKKVAVINTFLRVCIIGYVIGYAIVFKKGYQDFDNVQGAVTTKLKGVAMTKNLFSNTSGKRIWDDSDYVVPAQENNAFFVTTNLIVTDGQQLSTCEEDLRVPGANCTLDSSICVEGVPLMSGDGFMTGQCIDSKRDPGFKSCEVDAWCPTENGNTKKPNPPVLAIAENFTVFIKNNIEFPKFGIKRRNVPNHTNDTYLQSCRFDFENNNLCPIFELKTIAYGANIDNFVNISKEGGVIQIIIEWDCNLDHDVEECFPEYSFRRLDSADHAISKGYNFRYARYYKTVNNIDARTLFKAYGIKFIVTLQGRAGKFSVVRLLLNIGSGLALLSLAAIMCDLIVLRVLKAKAFYKEKKYLEVDGDDAYKRMDDDVQSIDSRP